MAKLLIAVAVSLVASVAADVSLPPASIKPLAVGIASGFVSDTPVLQMCGMQVAGEAAQFKTSLEDLKNAIKMPLNVTEIQQAIKEINEAVKAVPDVKSACQPLKSALVDLGAQLRDLHGPKDLMIHILDHLEQDGEKIFGEISDASKAWKTGWDYMTAGQNLGMAFRRMLVGEMNNTIVPRTPIPGCRKSIEEGMAIGFVSASVDFTKCEADAKTDAADLKKALADLTDALKHANLTAASEAAKAILHAREDAKNTKEECKEAAKSGEQNMKQIIAKLMAMHGLKDLAQHMFENLLSDTENINGDLAKAAVAYKSKDCKGAGRELGMAFRKILVGETKLRTVIV